MAASEVLAQRRAAAVNRISAAAQAIGKMLLAEMPAPPGGYQMDEMHRQTAYLVYTADVLDLIHARMRQIDDTPLHGSVEEPEARAPTPITTPAGSAAEATPTQPLKQAESFEQKHEDPQTPQADDDDEDDGEEHPTPEQLEEAKKHLNDPVFGGKSMNELAKMSNKQILALQGVDRVTLKRIRSIQKQMRL